MLGRANFYFLTPLPKPRKENRQEYEQLYKALCNSWSYPLGESTELLPQIGAAGWADLTENISSLILQKYQVINPKLVDINCDIVVSSAILDILFSQEGSWTFHVPQERASQCHRHWFHITWLAYNVNFDSQWCWSSFNKPTNTLAHAVNNKER